MRHRPIEEKKRMMIAYIKGKMWHYCSVGIRFQLCRKKQVVDLLFNRVLVINNTIQGNENCVSG
jgi:hypothetical protein